MSILLLILKIILIVILSLVGIALFLLAVVFLNLCRYEAYGTKNGEININARFKWFFGIIRGSYEINGDTTRYSLYVPFGICNINYSSDENNININLSEKNICNNDEFVNKGIANIEKNSKINIITEKIKGFFIGIKSFVCNVINKVKYVQRLNEKYCFNDIISATFKLLIKLIKNLGFKKFDLKGVIGFDSPDKTGKALGAISVAKAFVPLNIDIGGNFDEKELSGSFSIKGRTNLWLVLFPVAKYLLTKPVWPLVKDYRKGELNG